MKTTAFAAAIVATVLFAGHAMADSVSTTTVEETESAPVTTSTVEKTKVETVEPAPTVSKSTTVKTKTKVKPVKSSYSAEIKVK